MKQIHKNICETHILGEKTQTWVVKADGTDKREWLDDAPVCNYLNDYRIAHCGIMCALPPFQIVRTNLSGSFIFACLDGSGKILIDGDWQKVTAGQACVQPPFIPNALKATSKRSWTFCWVRYQEPSKGHPLVSLHAPSVGRFHGEPLRCAVQGLLAELSVSRSQFLMAKWSELIHSYVLSFAQPFCGDERLTKMWRSVEQTLQDAWTLERLANTACISKEHLRRKCLNSLGRTPVQHVTFLRMQLAAGLLVTTDHSIGKIATQVGYANQFSFSDTFQRWIGCRPLTYRQQRPRKI